MYNSPCTPLQCFTVVVALLSCRSQAQSSNTGCQQVWCFIYINAIHCKMVLMCCATILIAQINATMVVVVMACQRRLHNTTSVWDGFHGNYLLIPLWCGYCVLRFHQLQRWAWRGVQGFSFTIWLEWLRICTLSDMCSEHRCPHRVADLLRHTTRICVYFMFCNPFP